MPKKDTKSKTGPQVLAERVVDQLRQVYNGRLVATRAQLLARLHLEQFGNPTDLKKALRLLVKAGRLSVTELPGKGNKVELRLLEAS